MTDLWGVLLQTLTASGAAILLLAVKAMLQDKLPPRWQFAAWGVLAVILLLPSGQNGRYTLINWPWYVETGKSLVTGDYSMTQVIAPFPLPRWNVPSGAAEWLYTVYLVGGCVLLARYLFSYLRLTLVLRRCKTAEDTSIKAVRAVAEKYNLPLCRCVEVPNLHSPFVCGVLHPILALPAEDTVDSKVILHELIHLKNHDTAWGMLIAFLRCLHWFNPLLWYCANRAGNDLETRCDQQVLERLEGEERRNYGRILLSMTREKDAYMPGTSSIANGAKNTQRRIRAIARFKRYPAGMGFVSVCLLLILTVSLAAGGRTDTVWQKNLWDEHISLTAAMASARTIPCTTYEGAFDTYAKAVLYQNGIYRAMCAPESEQAALAAELRETATPPDAWAYNHWNPGLPGFPDPSGGYHIYHLERIEDGIWQGLLAVNLDAPPEGETWDGRVNHRWIAVQTIQAEKQKNRWVVTPLERFRALPGDQKAYGVNSALPVWRYEGQAGDFLIRLTYQARYHCKEDRTQNSGIFSLPKTDSTPKTDGTFLTEISYGLSAVYIGASEKKSEYSEICVSASPCFEEDGRLESQEPGFGDCSGSDSNGAFWGSAPLTDDWPSEIFLTGGGTSGETTDLTRPACYAAAWYVNQELVSNLTLFPVKEVEEGVF